MRPWLRAYKKPLGQECDKQIRRFAREHGACAQARPALGTPLQMVVPYRSRAVKLLFERPRRGNALGRGAHPGYVSLRLPFVPWRDRRVDLRVRRRGLLSLVFWLCGQRSVPIDAADLARSYFVTGDPDQARAFFDDKELREILAISTLFTDLRVTTGLDATLGVILPPTVQQFQACTGISEHEVDLIFEALLFYLTLGKALIRGLERQSLIQDRNPDRLIRPIRL